MTSNCTLCGEPMQPGEEMFKFHGSLGPCPKPPLPKSPLAQALHDEADTLDVIAGTYEKSDAKHGDALRALATILRAAAKLPERMLPAVDEHIQAAINTAKGA